MGLTLSEELETTEPEPAPERLLAMANGETIRVTRIDSTDIGFDRGALDEGGAFVPTLLYQGVPPIEGYDPEVGVSDEALAAHIADKIANPPPPPVPAQITRAQFIIAARRVLGLTPGTIKQIINSLAPAGEQRSTATDLFEHAGTFKRGNAFLNTIAAANGNTPEQLDEVFRVGAALELD